MLNVGMPLGLAYNSSRDAESVEDGDVNDDGKRTVVEGLGAIRPHVWTFTKVHITWTKARLEIGQLDINNKNKKIKN